VLNTQAFGYESNSYRALSHGKMTLIRKQMYETSVYALVNGNI